MNKILKNLNKKQKDKLKKKKMPDFTEPMLAKLSHERFYNKDWIYERKLDGERCLVFKKRKIAKLKSRNNKKINVSYPEIEKACGKIKPDNIILDGEIVAFEKNISSFAKLQNRMHVKTKQKAKETNVKVYYYIFDIIYFNGYDLSNLDLLSRKNILRKIIKFKDPLRYTRHRVNNTKKYYKQACQKGWEGLIVKKKQGKYVHSRSSNWQKFKCVNEQEFVIGGYTEPKGERLEFGALLLGYYKNNKLKYAGKVGTGFSDETLKKLGEKFKKNEQDKSPFADDVSEEKVHWLKPEFVCQIGFNEWTKDNKLRHPRFLGLRRDKSPEKVHKEK
ncbi:MAG: ATP-dependent DNA ligase [Candidatus Buchananbacteria bacterium]|nr:ATP-dependent DNA ligase [Candidatus Buchananbacteria bacterium]